MNNMHDLSFKLKDMLLYILGTVFVALGVVLIFKSDLGVSSWDVLHTALMLTTPLTFGTAIILVSAAITLFVIVYNRDMKFLFMAIPFVLVGLQVDLYDQVLLRDFAPSGFMQYLVFLTGLLIIPLGTVFLVLSKYPAGIYDELMLTLMRMFNTNRMALVRVLMETIPVLLGVTLTMSVHQHAGNLHVGTLVIVATAGPLIQTYLTLYRRLTHGNQQTD